MRLDANDLAHKAPWEAHGYALPQFDRASIRRNTLNAPAWVHFGAGNIFRAFPAALQQTLLDAGLTDTGIVVAEGYDEEIIQRAYRPYDDLSLLVVLKCDGTLEKRVIGSVVRSLTTLGPDWEALQAIFASPTLQMVSFTITEKGYSLTDPQGGYLPFVQADMEAGPAQPSGIIAKVTSLCYHRFLHGAAPLSLVSMDNCSHNGDKLFQAVRTMAQAWHTRGLVEADFVAYLSDPNKVAFPWSMIDKITPRPDAKVQAMLRADGFENTEIIETAKHTYTAPFVNAEEAQYLVIEDAFPNGRPPLEKAGVIFTTRKTVNQVERMKVCTCLNPLHTALAIFGCLLGCQTICQEMENPALKRLATLIGAAEGMPVVTDPGIIDPKAFLQEVLEVRLPNPFMPDTPQRIATDTSQKIAIRFGETLKAYTQDPRLDIHSLTAIPLTLAGWCRYLMGIDDQGQPFTMSPDPLLAELHEALKGVRLGDPGPFDAALRPILSQEKLFGVDLYALGLDGRIVEEFARLVDGPGAVARRLEALL